MVVCGVSFARCCSWAVSVASATERLVKSNGGVRKIKLNASGGAKSHLSLRSHRMSGTRENLSELELNSGLGDPDRNGQLVVVPASLIGALSRAGGVRSFEQDLFSSDGEIEIYLQITDREKSTIQQAWRKTRKQVYQLESLSAKSEDMSDGSVRIIVPDLSVEMKDCGEGFQNSVSEALGGNRAEAFIQMKQLDRMLTPPEGARVWTVKVEAVGDGRWRYHMGYEGPQGRKVWVGDSVPKEIRHITDTAKIKPDMNPAGENEDE